MLILFALLALAYSQANYTIIWQYPAGDNDCSGSPRGVVVNNNQPFCVEQSCACVGSLCGKTQCGQTELPELNGNYIVNAQYASNDCSGPVTTWTAAVSGYCANTTILGVASSTKISCEGGSFTTASWNNGDCSGDPANSQSVSFSGSRCIATPGLGSIYFQCNSACIHKESTVTYEGKALKLNQLATSEDCAVPHKVTRDGVKVTTTCPGVLRVTHSHLVMTPEGWTEAGNLKKGSKLFSKIGAETADCEVVSVETELKQQYFGLNCYESNVLADGYWISTFGSQHRIPAAWMKVGGSVLGVQRASAWGDAVVQTLEGWGLL